MKVILLGATGSIGTSTLSILRSFPGRFELVAASAHTNESGLIEIGREFGTTRLALSGNSGKSESVHATGPAELLDLIRKTEADIVVNGIAGSAGLMPSVAALESGKTLALANKETMVMAGGLVQALAAQTKTNILPVDSEHAALFALKERLHKNEVEELILTASGGAFRSLPVEDLASVSWRDALAHPTWDMGVKITIDSASMANKGLEVIEACELFGVPESAVKVVIHPQSCVHGMASTRDGSFYAQMSLPDMRVPIQNALTYPDVVDYPFEKLSFDDLKLDFASPESSRYPCLDLARYAARQGGSYPLAFNAANEVAVEGFINELIPFTAIPELIEGCLDGDWGNLVVSFEQVLELDYKARDRAASLLNTMAQT